MLFLYDGTYEGYLSAVFRAYLMRCEGNSMIRKRSFGLPLGGYTDVETSSEQSGRVAVKLAQLEMDKVLYKAWLTSEDGIDDAILLCINRSIERGCSVCGEKNIPYVKWVCDAAGRTGNEAHRFQQFVRFIKASESPAVYVADIEPQYDILPMLGNHFSKRFPSQFFVIRDHRFKKSLVWDKVIWYITEDPDILALQICDNSDFGKMWKGYFEAVAIPWRKNKKLQAAFVPQRFRKYLTEFN